jgi:xanthine dehydrogenase molybdopterin-binding subunit B
MDNFSAYELAVEMMNIEGTLTNTKVKYLSPNATSIHQPLNQGIIQNWKSYIKNQFVIFIAKTFGKGKDLSKEMHVLCTIR